MDNVDQSIQTLKQYAGAQKHLLEALRQALDNGQDTQGVVQQMQRYNDAIPQLLDSIKYAGSAVGEGVIEDAKPGSKPFPVKREIAKIDKGEQALEHEVLKRLKKKKKTVVKKKARKPSVYVKWANSFFGNLSVDMNKSNMFKTLKTDLVKANLAFLPVSYISVVFFTTMLSFFVAIFLTIFFLFLSLSAFPPFIVPTPDPFVERFFQVIWLIFIVPVLTFLFMYLYPNMEKKSLEGKIDAELPFVAINLSAIAGSKIEPSKMFSIIVDTGEFPHVSREFTKVINEVHIYGYDLVSALRETAQNTASRKLSEIFNSLATSLTSGGDLREFFDERSKNLLFEYRLSQERASRSAETFMDIYISVVIAAPMIFMLLIMMIRIGGLGLQNLSVSALTLIMILGVTMLNAVFIMFLYLKQGEG